MGSHQQPVQEGGKIVTFWYYTIPVVRGIFTELCASTIVQQELQTVQFHGFGHGLCQDFSLCMQKVIAGHQSHHGSKLMFAQSILCSIFPTQLACQRDKVSDIGSLEVPHLWVVLEGFLHINEILGSKCAWRGSIFALESHDLVNQKVNVLPAGSGKLVEGKVIEHISKHMSCHTKIDNMEPVQEIAFAGPSYHFGQRVFDFLQRQGPY